MSINTISIPNLLRLPNGVSVAVNGSVGKSQHAEFSLIDENGKETTLCSVDFQNGELAINLYEDDKICPLYTFKQQLSNTGGEKPQGKDF